MQILTTTEQSLANLGFSTKKKTILEDMAVYGQIQDATVNFLIQKMTICLKSRATTKFTKTANIMEELKQVNEQNGQLLEQSLEFVFTIRPCKANIQEQDSLYEKQGQTTEYEGQNFFDRNNKLK